MNRRQARRYRRRMRRAMRRASTFGGPYGLAYPGGTMVVHRPARDIDHANGGL